MASDNGRVSLSAIDFLGLVKTRKVARLDLADVGYEGVIYVRDLTAAEQAKVTGTGGKGAKARYYPDRSYEMDLAALTEAAGPKFLMAAVVTDTQDGAILEAAFAADPDAEHVMMSSAELVQMSALWIREAGTRQKAEETLESMPTAITNAVVKRVRELSGMVEDDRVEEKKDNS